MSQETLFGSMTHHEQITTVRDHLAKYGLSADEILVEKDLFEVIYEIDWAGLLMYAFLFTTSKDAGASSPRFMMSVDDAKTWCSSELSKGSESMYMWTSAAGHFARNPPPFDLSGCEDNGSYDDSISSLGLIKIPCTDFAVFLPSYGIKIKGRLP